MSYYFKSNKKLVIDDYLFIFVSVLTAGAFIFSLVEIKFAKIFFYNAVYLSIVAIVIDYSSIKKYLSSLPLALLILGISKMLWLIAAYFPTFLINIDNSYFQSGKRIILGAILIAYFIRNKDKIAAKSNISGIILAGCFILSSLQGLYQTMGDTLRIEFGTNRATDGAYMYSCIALTFISYLLQKKTRLSYILSTGVFFLSFYLIINTGTRIAIIAMPIISLILLICNTKFKMNRLSVGILVLFAILFSWVFRDKVERKIDQTRHEVNVYQQSNGNAGSSLGTRFAMWQVGLHVFQESPWGMSMEQRKQLAQQYIKQEGKYQSALLFINVHLHNEMIDTATLQGTIGVIILLSFYLSILYRSLKDRNLILLAVSLSLIFYGLTDVIFISREQTITFSLLLLLAYINKYQKNEMP